MGGNSNFLVLILQRNYSHRRIKKGWLLGMANYTDF